MIHPTAIVDPRASLGEGTEVGPFCVVGADVVLGEGTRLVAHVVVTGPCRIGARVTVHPFSAIGGPPQDRSYRGEPTSIEIGDDTEVREGVTIHRGTAKDRAVTRIGARVMLMASSHVGHDVQIGDDCTIANASLLAGHVVLEEGVVLGGAVAMAPFVRIGAIAFVAAGARVEQDVPPFHVAHGDRARIRALNVVGLERRAVPEVSRAALDAAHRAIYRSGRAIEVGVAAVAAESSASDPYVRRLLGFLSSRTTCPGPRAELASAPARGSSRPDGTE